MNTEAVALLRELVGEVRALRADLADQRTGPDVRMLLLLRAAHRVLGGEPFTAARLVALSESPLRAALHQAVDGRTPHSIGKCLADHIGRVIDGLRLERIGRSRPAVYRLIDVDSTNSRKANPWHC